MRVRSCTAASKFFPRVHAGANGIVYYDEVHPTKKLAPDLFVGCRVAHRLNPRFYGLSARGTATLQHRFFRAPGLLQVRSVQ